MYNMLIHLPVCSVFHKKSIDLFTFRNILLSYLFLIYKD